MLNRLHLAALLAALAVPALAQTAAPTTPPAAVARPPMSTPAAPPPAAMRTPAAPTAPAAPGPAAVKPAVPAAQPAAQPATMPAATGGRVDINSASESQLDAALTGVGPVRAKAIIAGRPYADLADLVKKRVLTQGVFDKAKPGMALASINGSTASQLEKTLPGIGEVRSKAIVAGRPYAAPTDLVSKGVLTQSQFDKISGLIAL